MLAQREVEPVTLSTVPANDSATGIDPLDDWFTPVRFALLLGLLLVITFPGILAGQQSFFFRDYGVLSYPTIFYARESFWRGELPLWNPFSHCGVPFLAQWGPMVLYPFSIIYLLFPLPWSLGLFSVLHLLLGGCGMHALASRWTGSRFAGAVAGVLFVFNGVVFSSLAWPNYTVALGWMPWVALATQNAWERGGRTIIWAGLAGAMQMLSGVPEVVLLTWLFLGVLWLVEMMPVGRTVPVSRLQRTRRFLAVIALVAGLSAAQLLPFFELVAHSHRHTGSGASSWAMPAWGWANLFVPLFRCAKSSQGIFYQPGHVFLITYYLGITTLVLAAMALWKARDRRAYLLGAAALFGLTISLGNSGYLYGWLTQMFPVVGFARFPIKCIYITLFTLPLLAAYGIQRFRAIDENRRGPRAPLICSAAAALVCGALLWIAWQFPIKNQHWSATASNTAVRLLLLVSTVGVLIIVARRVNRWQPLLGCLLLVLLWLDAQTHTPRPHPTIHASHFSPGLSPMPSPPKLGQGRALITDWAEDRQYRSGVADFSKDFLGKRLGLWCNAHLLEGIPKLEGASTLLVREQAQVQGLFYRNPDTDHPALADFLGVTHVNAPEQVTEWITRSNALPLIMAGQKPVFVDGTNGLRSLAADDFDPRAVVYLPASAREQISVTAGASAQISNVDFQRHRITFRVDAAQPCLVTVAQTFYPAWRAAIDGRETPIQRANHAFQAIEVPAGAHDVRFAYVDRKFQAGAVISLASLLLCGIAGGRRPGRLCL
jgi:hypothetical protein